MRSGRCGLSCGQSGGQSCGLSGPSCGLALRTAHSASIAKGFVAFWLSERGGKSCGGEASWGAFRGAVGFAWANSVYGLYPYNDVSAFFLPPFSPFLACPFLPGPSLPTGSQGMAREVGRFKPAGSAGQCRGSCASNGGAAAALVTGRCRQCKACWGRSAAEEPPAMSRSTCTCTTRIMQTRAPDRCSL